MSDAGELKTSIFHVNRDRGEQRLPHSLLVFTTAIQKRILLAGLSPTEPMQVRARQLGQ